MPQLETVGQLGHCLQVAEDQKLLQVNGQLPGVFGQLRGHQKLYAILAHQLVAGGIPPSSNVGIN